MDGGKEYKFTEVIDKIIDNRGKTAPTATKGIPLIATNCIKEDGLFPVYEKIRYVSQETYNSWFRGHPQPDDIIFVNKGNAGFVCLTPNPVDFCIAQDMVAIRANPKLISPRYLFAFLRSKEFKNQVDSLNVGTTIPHLKKTVFNELIINIPNRKLQDFIGDLYFDLSYKIELNRQMNHTLEQMAQALYKQHFVDDIDPENLPDGWRNGIVSDILTLEYGKSLREDERKGGIYPVIGSSGIVGFHNASLVKGKCVVVGRKGNAGSVFWCDDDFYPIDTTFYVVSKFLDTRLYYTFFLLKSLNLGSYNSDSAVPGLNRNHAHDSEIIIPVESVVSEFNNQAETLFQMIAVNNSEIVSLTKTRDYLLPKLISGELIPSDLQTIEQAL